MDLIVALFGKQQGGGGGVTVNLTCLKFSSPALILQAH